MSKQRNVGGGGVETTCLQYEHSLRFGLMILAGDVMCGRRTAHRHSCVLCAKWRLSGDSYGSGTDVRVAHLKVHRICI